MGSSVPSTAARWVDYETVHESAPNALPKTLLGSLELQQHGVFKPEDAMRALMVKVW